MTRPLFKFNKDLQEVCRLGRFDLAALQSFHDCDETVAALDRLEARGALMDAARLCAFALPGREAVWWASRCAIHTVQPGQPPIQQEAREAAEAWVRRQDDAQRRSAMDLARQAGFDSPEAWVAVGSFWCGDSMAPVGQPAIRPAPHLTGTAVVGAVALAAVRGDAARQQPRLARFLASARDIASGGAGHLGPDAD